MSTFLHARSVGTDPAPSDGTTNPPPRILIVDDDAAIRQVSTKVLAHSGFQVDAAEDGVAGWECLQAGNYDLLITDQNMPKMSGLELVQKVRSARMTLPVILASGGLPVEELERNPSLQVAALLPKPFFPGQLVETVKAVLCARA